MSMQAQRGEAELKLKPLKEVGGQYHASAALPPESAR
jgi:hypothetical protein